MKYLKLILLLIFGVLIITRYTGEWSPEEKPTTAVAHASWQQLVDYARQHLAMHGQLQMKPDGFVYLKVDNNYIHTLYPLLELSQEGYRKPPYFRSHDALGAHISVFNSNEHIQPKEIGQTFPFEVKDIIIVHTNKNTSYAVLRVYSPELEKLRNKYGLDSKLQGHEFHITLAKKTRSFR